MGLRVSEKNHWRDRIAKRIEQRIETLVARNDPTLLQRISEQARERAYESLGIQSQQRELEAIQKQREELDKRQKRLRAQQRAVVNGTSVEDELERGGYYGHRDHEVEQAVTARAKALESDILGESDLGKRIVALREEKDNLLDTVWLATTCGQIKELWEHLNSFLEFKPTALERRALKIAPLEGD